MGLEISRYHVRRAVQINATPSVVWYEFRDFVRLNAWFGKGHQLEVFEPGENGRVELSVDLDGAPQGFGGNIVVWEEDREMSFENNWFGENAWPVPTLITFRLTGMFDGTHVELFHHGFERLGRSGDKQFLAYEAGWDVHHLALLKTIVEKY